MTAKTIRLLGRRAQRGDRSWIQKLAAISRRLGVEYGSPTLGNYRDPVKEIIYIVLSAKTTERLYKLANRKLWQRFSTISELANASQREVASCIRIAGLGAKRARHLRRIARILVRDFGEKPSGQLRRLSHEQAYAYLTRLPGVGPKSAFCVMMYSLDIDVFPVDANIHRIARRMGIISTALKHYQAQNQLPLVVPAGEAKRLHIGMLVHGRKVCTPRAPRCSECCISRWCGHARNAVSKKGRLLDGLG